MSRRAGKRGGRALGRGLDALFPEAAPDAAPQPPVRELPLDAIEPNPQQPRRSFGGDQADELTRSISQHGVLQPLLVRRADADRYQLVAGERRWRAARAAGLQQVPVVVLDTPDSEMLTLALVENLQREDLNPIDQAAAFQYLLDAGLTQAELSRRVGKSRSAVANAVRLLQLPADLQAEVAAARLSEGHARAILAAPKAQQRQLAEAAIAGNLSVRQIEAEARLLQVTAQITSQTGGQTDVKPPPKQAGIAEAAAEAWRIVAAERLQQTFNTRASISQDSAQGGRITLRWYSQEQLEQLVAQLTAAPPPGNAPGDASPDREITI